MRILILGGSGLVGRHVIARLKGAHEVIAPGRQELDLASDWDPSGLPAHIDAIVHVAQARSWRDFPRGAPETIAVNLTSTAKLLDYAAAREVRSLVYASTGGVYEAGTQLLDETSPLRVPQKCDLYIATKLASEQLIAGYQSLLSASVLRLFTVYGEGADPDSLFPRLERSIREGRAITLVGPDGVILRPTQADDVARVIEACLAVPAARTLNVAGPDLVTLRQLALQIGQRLGRAPVFEEVEGAAPVLAPASSIDQTLDRVRSATGS